MAIRFLNGIDAEGRKILQVGDPTDAKDAANKAYVDASVPSLTNYVTLNTTQTISGAKTFSSNVELASTADLVFKDTNNTYPTSGKGFDWTLNNDGARIYAMQPSSDSIDFVFKLRDNATLNDRFVFWVDDYTGVSGDRYPLVIRGGTQFDLVDSSLYTDGTIRLSNAGALTVTSGTFTGNIVLSGGGARTIQSGGDIGLKTSTGEYALYGAANGNTNLYYNGVQHFRTGPDGVVVTGNIELSTIANETSAAGKFLVGASNGVVKYRTGAEVLSDIGGAPATGGSYLPKAGGVMSGKIGRSTAIVGFLEGSYNNVGSNFLNSNPIYTIGSSYNPASTTLSNMYGVGYCGSGASFINLTGASDWGFYVAADGDARVWLDGSTGNISHAGDLYVGGGDIILAGTGRIQGVDTVSAGTDAANKTYVDSNFAKRYSFNIGAGAGSRKYIKLWTMTDTDDGVSGFLSMSGDYGDADKGAYQLLVGTRSGTISMDVFETSIGVISDNFEFFYKDIGTSYEIWMLASDYNYPGQTAFIPVATFGGVTYNFDSITTTTPSGLVSVPNISFVNTVTAQSIAGTKTFTSLVSGVTPTAAANFVTKAYADGLTPGAGVFLPLSGGTMTGNTHHNDSVLSTWGTGRDLTIEHDGSNSYIKDSGTGDLVIDAGATRLRNAAGLKTFIEASSASVELYHNGVKKFETTSTGVAVEGQVTALTDKATPEYSFKGDTDTGLIQYGGTADGIGFMLGGKDALSMPSTGKLQLHEYTAVAVSSSGGEIDPNQNFQAGAQDTLALLAVDPTGQVVRGSQEATWTFTKAQIDALTTSTTSGTTLIAAPGANKAIIVEESNLMIKYSGTGTMSSNSFVIRQAHNGDAAAEVTRLPSGQINTIMSSAPTNPSYGFYSRDLPLYNNDGRSFVTDKATFLTRISTNATPSNLLSITIKLKYRLFNVLTFD